MKILSPRTKNRPPLATRLQEVLDEVGVYFRGEPNNVRVTVVKITPVILAIRRLIEARKSLPMTQGQVAKKSGIDLKTIQKLEKGQIRKPSVELLEKYAATVGLQLTLTFNDTNP